MVVYIDVLIFTNLIVNFFILEATAFITSCRPKVFRQILSAFAGALFSLYIFLPDLSVFVDILIKALMAAIIIFIAFGWVEKKRFIRCVVCFFLSSFIFAGIMMAIWFLLSPKGLLINNDIVYFNISPFILIAGTVISYVMILIIRKIMARNASLGARYEIYIETQFGHYKTVGMFDTGHSVQDIYSGLPVIICDKNASINLGPKEDNEKSIAGSGYRLIPFNTVSGKGLVPAYTCNVTIEKAKICNKKAVAALTDQILGDDYGMIFGSDLIEISRIV